MVVDRERMRREVAVRGKCLRLCTHLCDLTTKELKAVFREIERDITQWKRRDRTLAQELASCLDWVLGWCGYHILPVDVPAAHWLGRCRRLLSTQAPNLSLPHRHRSMD